MIVYTNEEHRIVAHGTTDRTDLQAIDVGDYFDGKCDEYIFGYECTLNYKLLRDDKGNVVKDASGNPKYELDENGNKIILGYTVVPWDNYDKLSAIQSAYETITLALADLIGGAYE